MSLDPARYVSEAPPPNRDRPVPSWGTLGAPGLRFVLVVFVVMAIAIASSFVVFLFLPRQQSSPTDVAFGDPVFIRGNVSLSVQRVSGGPYSSTGFRVNLVVNNFAGQSTPLGAGGSVVRIQIGPNTYRVSWEDLDGDGRVSERDTFAISGDGVPLPSLSSYEFDLQWQDAWTAHAFWSTD